MTTSTGEARATTRGGGIPADTFAARLMLVRMHAGNLTIQDAADRVGLVAQSWSNWEKGMTPRDKSDIARDIADEFGVDLPWLLYGGPLTPEVSKRRDRHGRNGESVRTTAYLSSARRPHDHRPNDHRPNGHAPGTTRPEGAPRPVRLTPPIAA
jgi:transcriptional regulator with XRE-family HTH domain